MVYLPQISEMAPRAMQSRCGGRQLADKISAQPRPLAGCAELKAGVSRRAQQDCIDATAPSSAEGHRHALGGLAARGVRAWCWSFSSWLSLSYGLARGCLLQGGTIRCVATRARERSHGNAHAHRLRIAWQVVGSLKRASHESIPSIHQLRE